jgi:hypothetical protein
VSGDVLASVLSLVASQAATIQELAVRVTALERKSGVDREVPAPALESKVPAPVGGDLENESEDKMFVKVEVFANVNEQMQAYMDARQRFCEKSLKLFRKELDSVVVLCEKGQGAVKQPETHAATFLKIASSIRVLEFNMDLMRPALDIVAAPPSCSLSCKHGEKYVVHRFGSVALQLSVDGDAELSRLFDKFVVECYTSVFETSPVDQVHGTIVNSIKWATCPYHPETEKDVRLHKVGGDSTCFQQGKTLAHYKEVFCGNENLDPAVPHNRNAFWNLLAANLMKMGHDTCIKICAKYIAV